MKPAALSYKEWEVEQLLLEIGQLCGECGEDIHVTDDVYLLQIVTPNYIDGTFNYWVVQSEKGEYAYDPYFFHQSCWADTCTEWEENAEEPLPKVLSHDQQYVIGACVLCESHIQLSETSGLLVGGSFTRSPRSPGGESSVEFEPSEEPMLICISCLHDLNTNGLEMWPYIGLTNICEAGLKSRCWRTGACQNGCQLARAAE